MSAETAFAHPQSEPAEPDTSYAEKIIKDAKLLRKGQNGEPAIYKIPLNRIMTMKGTYESYIFGEQSEIYLHHKVIMMVGKTGTGKSTLINAMINCILGVEWEDGFRFKIVDEQGEGQSSKADSQTQIISTYTIGRNINHNIPYTLTIIDMPGFGNTRGIERDKAIIVQLREFFSNPEHHQVDHIDGVCFVVSGTDLRPTPTRRYVWDAILALLGKDVQPNILPLVTFCDESDVSVLEAIKEVHVPCNGTGFKFNNGALYGKNSTCKANDDSDEMAIIFHRSCWQKVRKNLKDFFERLNQLSPKSVSLTKDVLEERIRLENTAEKLELQIQIANYKLENLVKEKDLLEHHKQEIEANKSFEYEVDVRMSKRIETSDCGLYCKTCHYTCQYPCRNRGDNTRKYHEMFSAICFVCPKKCALRDHTIENFRIEYTIKKKRQTYADIEQRYRDATKKKVACEQKVQELEAYLEVTEQAVCELIAQSNRCVNHLQQIALKPQPLGVKEYLNLWIEQENWEAKPGWQSRVLKYEQLKKREEYKSEHIWTRGKKQVAGAFSAITST